MLECKTKEDIDCTTISVVVSTIFTIVSLCALVWICILLNNIGVLSGSKKQKGCKYLCVAIVLLYLLPGPGTLAAIVLLVCATEYLKD